MDEDMNKQDMPVTTVRTWNRAFLIPNYLIQDIGDHGMEEVYDEEGHKLDSDDLRVSVTLSTGVSILLDGYSRIVACPEGMWVEFLSEPHEL